ncbi:hypothetical protein MNBD_PLANCTO02-914 [hydrothermal vent metagenome]|uniref:Uncharacterized protein n=1 Tax=hydrothermal vent metagenome TaxID=652676 RepID=A0A3B1DQW0_9ZZZZ
MSLKTWSLVSLLSLFCLSSSLMASKQLTKQHRQRIAVALNYSRASFHRIRKNPIKRVLVEEQEKILNNLNLSQIDDAEVVKLYTSVLDEINRIQIADKERHVIKERFNRDFQRELLTTAMGLGAQVATLQYTSAVKTGASSWWDYRSLSWRRDNDALRVEKERMLTVVNKSSQFLDTFWKLTRKRNIPDRWLIRSNDLDELDVAMKEKNLETRLRILHRMERFMTCYPPYWYYIGRTEQMLGKTKQAAKTYQKMALLGNGHFRKDEMLAAGLTNLALIQEYSHDKHALATAKEALQQATTSWQANLVCAWILEKHGNKDQAEDTILRNIDLHLEEQQSRINLVALYYRTNNLPKLSAQLKQSKVVATLPMSLLIPCAAKLQQSQSLPAPVVKALSETLEASLGGRLGHNDFVVTAPPKWRLQTAGISLEIGKQEFSRSTIQQSKQQQQVRFSRVGQHIAIKKENGNISLSLLLQYPATPPIRIHLQERPSNTITRLALNHSFQIKSIDVEELPQQKVAHTKKEMQLTGTTTHKKTLVKVQTYKPTSPKVFTISLQGKTTQEKVTVPPAPQTEFSPPKTSPKTIFPSEHFLPHFRPARRR